METKDRTVYTGRSAAAAFVGGAIMALLLAVLYLPSLPALLQVLLEDPNASHGLLVPLIVAFFVWRKRRALAAAPKATSRKGLLLLLVGAAVLPLGKAAEIGYLQWLSLLIVAGGIVWHVWGDRRMRILLFPYLFLFLMLPWPGLLVETLTFHLQLISTKTATLVLGLLGVPIVREGVEIHMGAYTFAVAAPCSGMRSMAALVALGALCAYVLQGALWQRIVLLAAVPPLAMAGNMARIVIILLLARSWGREIAEGFYHQFSGVVVFLVTFALLIGLARLLGMGKMREGA